jgi:hypothetical protein
MLKSMTKEQIQRKGQEKVQAIETLCKQLEITVSAEQMIDKQGFIKMVVYYLDTQKYEVDAEEITPKEDENQTT